MTVTIDRPARQSLRAGPRGPRTRGRGSPSASIYRSPACSPPSWPSAPADSSRARPRWRRSCWRARCCCGSRCPADPFAGWSRARGRGGAGGGRLRELDARLGRVVARARGARSSSSTARCSTCSRSPSTPRSRASAGSLTVLLRWVLLAFTARRSRAWRAGSRPSVADLRPATSPSGCRSRSPTGTPTGIAAALGAVLALHHGSGDRRSRRWCGWRRRPRCRCSSPPSTSPSRAAAIAAGALGVIVVRVLARPRRCCSPCWPAGPACVVAVTAAYGAEALATRSTSRAAGPGAGPRRSALVLVLACLGAGGGAGAAAAARARGRRDRRRARAPAADPGRGGDRRRAWRARRGRRRARSGSTPAERVPGGRRRPADRRRPRPADPARQQRAARGSGAWPQTAFADHRCTGTGAGTFRVE